MKHNRLFIPLFAAVIVVVMLQSPAEALWGFGSGRDKDGSGLNLDLGYDRNTVTTLTGRVAVAPDQASDPVTIELLVGSERLVVVMGPRWYWQDDRLEFKAGDLLTVRGSRAQGKDGRSYLLVQRITGPGDLNIEVRAENGRPNWAGGNRGGQSGPQQRAGGAGSGGSRRGR